MRWIALGLLVVGLGNAGATEPKKAVAPVAAPAGNCESCKDGTSADGKSKGSFLRRLKERWNGDTGCDQPFGCDNAHTQFKFAFGSCRNFFGNNSAAQGHGHRTTVPE